MESTWILISDASRARLFLRSRQSPTWTLLEEIEHPESRARNQELVTDRGGNPKAQEAERFARLLAERLERGLEARRYRRLILSAPPQFLGALRGCLSPRVAERVSIALDKDLTQLPPRALPARLNGARG